MHHMTKVVISNIKPERFAMAANLGPQQRDSIRLGQRDIKTASVSVFECGLDQITTECMRLAGAATTHQRFTLARVVDKLDLQSEQVRR